MIKKITTPFIWFFKLEAASGLLLLISATIALIISNSSLSNYYFSTLNEYFSDMIDIVFKYNGTLDKIIGDELMIVYGAPISSEDDTERAVLTAIEMQNQIEKLNETRKKRKESPIKVGVGINRGLVVSGNIGSRDMMDYTVIGDTVNLGARLCSAAGPDEIFVSENVFQETKNKFPYKKLEPIKVKGKEKKVNVYEIKA